MSGPLRDDFYRCPNLRGGTENMFCVLACHHFTVHDQDGYVRVYDEDDEILVRVGDLRAVLDVATMSMDFASGFLDEEQVEALRKIATLLGIDPIEVTPHNFVCKYTGTHQWQPMPQRFKAGPMVPTGDPPEMIEALDAAKAAGDLAGIDAASAVLQAERAERRAERQSWNPPEPEPLPPEERCVLCHQTRLAPPS